jgi:uncharacterized protein
MNDLIVVGLAGFAASFVDGSLGMGFGPTSSSILLTSGLSPASISTTINISKVATGLAAGAAHWRFGNIDRRLVLKLALPGCAGALIGVTVLSNVDGSTIKPYLSALLIIVAMRILLRFRRPLNPQAATTETGEPVEYNTRGITLAGTAGGLTNGLIGAWGPVVTPFLMHRRVPPRTAIGSVNTAEIAVAFVSVGALIGSIGSGGLDVGTVAAMLIGGVLAAPIAAWVIRFLPARALGLCVAGLLMFTNARELSTWADLGGVRWAIYLAIPLLVIAAAVTGGRTRPDALDGEGSSSVVDPISTQS